ncbi:NUDIX domain-containing protein [Lacinutrix undariae]
MNDRLKNITRTILSKEWATLYRINYDYKFNDGIWKSVSRESYDRGNGACVLLYNTEKNTVILTSQFRMPIYENNDNKGYSVEVCAGVIDGNEDAETCVIRETEEEVGYKILSAKKVLETYMSPGAVTEKIFLFVAEYTDAMKVNSGGGLISEREEIEVLEIPFTDALKMLRTGEIQDAKTVLLLQYAQLNKLVSFEK